ncbi:MAG TPA: hypothetical protein VJ982_00480 [Gemmatimonadota bacterium]|nr:hypothetical protein [Gemmatimonadota bacterium]
MPPRTLTMVRRPPSLRGIPPRYQVFDRRKRPPMTVAMFYRDLVGDTVVFEVYDDEFRELLKQDPALRGKRFEWMIDVAPNAPGDTITEIVRPAPMPIPTRRGPADVPALTLEEALAAVQGVGDYRVIRTSDPL